MQRGKVLRDALGVGDLKPLKSRVMRDMLAHYDQRIDDYLRQQYHLVAYVDANVTSDRGQGPPPNRLRHLDGDLILTFRGESPMRLADVHRAILRLSARIESGNWQGITPGHIARIAGGEG